MVMPRRRSKPWPSPFMDLLTAPKCLTVSAKLGWSLSLPEVSHSAEKEEEAEAGSVGKGMRGSRMSVG